jgi:hypothetical protein
VAVCNVKSAPSNPTFRGAWVVVVGEKSSLRFSDRPRGVHMSPEDAEVYADALKSAASWARAQNGLDGTQSCSVRPST